MGSLALKISKTPTGSFSGGAVACRVEKLDPREKNESSSLAAVVIQQNGEGSLNKSSQDSSLKFERMYAVVSTPWREYPNESVWRN
jgi:hypothetical protein